MIEDIKKIIEAGIQAPSGENCQPWRFRISDNEIMIFNVPERDQSLYNYGQRGSFFAHGAAIENMSIAASKFGYDFKVNLFPDPTNADLVAIIKLQKTSVREDELYDYIFKRSTNRKKYNAQPLSESDEKYILGEDVTFPDVKIKFTQDRSAIEKLAEYASVNERLLFQNKHLHDFFFSHLRWTDTESEKYRDGFYIKTLELEPPQLKAMSLFKNWKVLNIFNKLIGVSKKIAADNAKTYQSCAAIGIITIPTSDPVKVVNSGRVIERVWLKATRNGLSLQPMTGLIFFMQNILAGKTEQFSEDEIKLIKETYQNIRKIFNVENDQIIFLFRVGISEPPSARSPRKLASELID